MAASPPSCYQGTEGVVNGRTPLIALPMGQMSFVRDKFLKFGTLELDFAVSCDVDMDTEEQGGRSGGGPSKGHVLGCQQDTGEALPPDSSMEGGG